MNCYGPKIGVAIEEIDPDLKPASLMRVSLNGEAIERYTETFKTLPPVKLMVDTNGHHWVVDGAHTISAARKLGLKDIQAIVKNGTYHEAFKEASHSNSEHGVRITNEDKRYRVNVALADDVMAGWSNRLIADACGVSHQLVCNIKPEQLSTVDSCKTVGRDGKGRSAPKPRQPRGEPFVCQTCGDEFNSAVWHCSGCGDHLSASEKTCPKCHKSDVTFDETSDTKSEIDAAFPAREGEGWQDSPTLVVEPQREPLPNQTAFDFQAFWEPIHDTMVMHLKRCPDEYKQDFLDATESIYHELFYMVPGAVRFERVPYDATA